MVIGEIEDLRQLLLNGGDAARICTADDSLHLLRERKGFLFDDFPVFDHIDCDVRIHKGENVQIQRIDIAFHLQDIFFAHGVAPGILNDCDCAVQLIQSEVMIELQTFAGLDVIQNKAFFDFSDIQHNTGPPYTSSSSVAISAMRT